MAQAEEAAGQWGRPGASARAEYERREARDEARRRAIFGPLAPVVRCIAGPKPSTEAWGRGAAGEEHVGRWLDDVVDGRGVVLHDRALPHRCANIDHIAVVASGIWVIDTKHFRGRLERRELGGWFVPRPRLFVAGREQSRLVTFGAPAAGAGGRDADGSGAGGRSTRPGRVVLHRGPGRALHPALHPGGGARHLAPGVRPDPGRSGGTRARRATCVGGATRRGLPALCCVEHPALQAQGVYAPGGTSHSPTGASPSG